MFTKEEIQQAKDANLVDLLHDLNYPLKRITDREYALVAHDSCRISPTRGFYWHSRSIGGNAIDFFMTLEGMSFIDAVSLILSKSSHINFTTKSREVDVVEKKEPLKLPVAHWNNDRVIGYLTEKRKIDLDIVLYCISKKILYESANNHNAVFLGFDQDGKAEYAFQRGTSDDKRFAGDVEGSKKEYGFFLGNPASNILHLFESPIDLLSYLTLEKYHGRKCRDAYVSLSGISLKAFAAYQKRHSQINTVYVRSDNDNAGRKAYERLIKYCTETQLAITILPAHPKMKDYNDELKAYINIERSQLHERH